MNIALQKCSTILLGTNPLGFAADFLASQPKSDFLKSLIINLEPKNSFFGFPIPYLTVLFSTGPVYVALQYAHFLNKQDICVLMPELHEEGKGREEVFFTGSPPFNSFFFTIFTAFLVQKLKETVGMNGTRDLLNF